MRKEDAMDSIEKIAQITKFVEEDKGFGQRVTAAMEAKDTDAIVALAAEKGIELSVEELTQADPATEGRELDADELAAIAGGTATGDAILEECGKTSAFFCGFYLLTSLWAGCGNE